MASELYEGWELRQPGLHPLYAVSAQWHGLNGVTFGLGFDTIEQAKQWIDQASERWMEAFVERGGEEGQAFMMKKKNA